MEVLTHGILHLLKPDILELLVGFAVLVTILVLAGLVFQKISSAIDARRFPPPGQMVDVGGHRRGNAERGVQKSARKHDKWEVEVIPVPPPPVLGRNWNVSGTQPGLK